MDTNIRLRRVDEDTWFSKTEDYWAQGRISDVRINTSRNLESSYWDLYIEDENGHPHHLYYIRIDND